MRFLDLDDERKTQQRGGSIMYSDVAIAAKNQLPPSNNNKKFDLLLKLRDDEYKKLGRLALMNCL
jgi:hypothetical protein